MIENLLILPVLLPLLTAILCGLGKASLERQRQLTLAAYLVQLITIAWFLFRYLSEGDILVLRLGDWRPGIGIVWIADFLSLVFLLLATLLFLSCTWSSPEGLDEGEKIYFFPLLNLLSIGVNGSFLTGDLFNLFVFFEIMLIASFVLISQGTKKSRIKAALPYIVINLMASGLFLFALGLLYATTGSLTLAHLRLAADNLQQGAVFWAASLILILVFSLKSGLVPWHFWLPDSYPRASIPVNALFAGLLTKVGIYCLYRLLPLLRSEQIPHLEPTLLLIASLTMVFGVLGALGRHHMREILSFHIISQVGYMVFALGLGTVTGMAAGMFYVMHHMLVKSALFFAVGIPELRAGHGRLGGASGFIHKDVAASLAFFLPALALAGIPPLSGFWGKFFLIYAGFQSGAWLSTAIAVLVSLLTLASMLKIWNYTYWGDEKQVDWLTVPTHRLRTSALTLALLSIVLGLGAGAAWEIIQERAEELWKGEKYIEAVRAAEALSRR